MEKIISNVESAIDFADILAKTKEDIRMAMDNFRVAEHPNVALVSENLANIVRLRLEQTLPATENERIKDLQLRAARDFLINILPMLLATAGNLRQEETENKLPLPAVNRLEPVYTTTEATNEFINDQAIIKFPGYEPKEKDIDAMNNFFQSLGIKIKPSLLNVSPKADQVTTVDIIYDKPTGQQTKDWEDILATDSDKTKILVSVRVDPKTAQELVEKNVYVLSSAMTPATNLRTLEEAVLKMMKDKHWQQEHNKDMVRAILEKRLKVKEIDDPKKITGHIKKVVSHFAPLFPQSIVSYPRDASQLLVSSLETILARALAKSIIGESAYQKYDQYIALVLGMGQNFKAGEDEIIGQTTGSIVSAQSKLLQMANNVKSRKQFMSLMKDLLETPGKKLNLPGTDYGLIYDEIQGIMPIKEVDKQ